MIGGIVKAVSVKPDMMAITFGSLANVMVYAAASAGVGYVVKKVLDNLSAKISDKCDQFKSQEIKLWELLWLVWLFMGL
jgi:hypothetical protein